MEGRHVKMLCMWVTSWGGAIGILLLLCPFLNWLGGNGFRWYF